MLILLFLVLYSHGTGGYMVREYISGSNSQRNWTESVKACTDHGLDIAVDTGLDFRRETSINVNISVGNKAWVGHYLTYTEFYWYQGCFERTSGNDKAQDMGETARLSDCVEICGEQATIGIQLTTCICLSDTDSYSIVVANLCDKPCAGNKKETCGGENHMSVYEIAARDKLAFRDLFVDSECVTLEIQEYGDESLVPWLIVRPCTDRLAYICKFYNENETEYYVQETAIMLDWYEAQLKCNTDGGYLAQVDNTTISLLPRVGFGTPRWIGMLRIADWKEAEYYNAENDALIACGALENVVKDNETNLEWSPTSCDLSLDFICQNETTIETTPVEKTTMKSTTEITDTSDVVTSVETEPTRSVTDAMITTLTNTIADNRTEASTVTIRVTTVTANPLKAVTEKRIDEEIVIGVSSAVVAILIIVIIVAMVCLKRRGYIGGLETKNTYAMMPTKQLEHYKETDQVQNTHIRHIDEEKNNNV